MNKVELLKNLQEGKRFLFVKDMVKYMFSLTKEDDADIHELGRYSVQHAYSGTFEGAINYAHLLTGDFLPTLRDAIPHRFKVGDKVRFRDGVRKYTVLSFCNPNINDVSMSLGNDTYVVKSEDMVLADQRESEAKSGDRDIQGLKGKPVVDRVRHHSNQMIKRYEYAPLDMPTINELVSYGWEVVKWFEFGRNSQYAAVIRLVHPDANEFDLSGLYMNRTKDLRYTDSIPFDVWSKTKNEMIRNSKYQLSDDDDLPF